MTTANTPFLHRKSASSFKEQSNNRQHTDSLLVLKLWNDTIYAVGIYLLICLDQTRQGIQRIHLLASQRCNMKVRISMVCIQTVTEARLEGCFSPQLHCYYCIKIEQELLLSCPNVSGQSVTHINYHLRCAT